MRQTLRPTGMRSLKGRLNLMLPSVEAERAHIPERQPSRSDDDWDEHTGLGLQGGYTNDE